MRTLRIDVDCEKSTCGSCQCRVGKDNWCACFEDFPKEIETYRSSWFRRLPECLAAEIKEGSDET